MKRLERVGGAPGTHEDMVGDPGSVMGVEDYTYYITLSYSILHHVSSKSCNSLIRYIPDEAGQSIYARSLLYATSVLLPRTEVSQYCVFTIPTLFINISQCLYYR